VFQLWELALLDPPKEARERADSDILFVLNLARQAAMGSLSTTAPRYQLN
jgi:hypothetical protein